MIWGNLLNLNVVNVNVKISLETTQLIYTLVQWTGICMMTTAI